MAGELPFARRANRAASTLSSGSSPSDRRAVKHGYEHLKQPRARPPDQDRAPKPSARVHGHCAPARTETLDLRAFDMNCPRCRLINPPEAERCDCGYEFVSKTMKGGPPPRPTRDITPLLSQLIEIPDPPVPEPTAVREMTPKERQGQVRYSLVLAAFFAVVAVVAATHTNWFWVIVAPLLALFFASTALYSQEPRRHLPILREHVDPRR
jgi:hypothetical protein